MTKEQVLEARVAKLKARVAKLKDENAMLQVQVECAVAQLDGMSEFEALSKYGDFPD